MIKLLIADDHALLREGLKRLFGTVADMELVGEANDGAQVLRRVAEGGIDVLLLDLCMPGMSGIDLIREVRRAASALPILVLSMHEEAQCALPAIRAGAQAYLCKDSDFEHIVAAVRRLADGRLYMSPAVADQLAWGAMPPDTAIVHKLLSARELEVFLLLVEGKSVSNIAALLRLSVKTISTHKARMMQKMRMPSLSAMVQYAVAHQLLRCPLQAGTVRRRRRGPVTISARARRATPPPRKPDIQRAGAIMKRNIEHELERFFIVYRGAPAGSADASRHQPPRWAAWFDALGGRVVDRGSLTHSSVEIQTRLAGPKSSASALSGYCIVEAADFNEAVKLAEQCPIFDEHGSVEIARLAAAPG